MLWAQVWSLVRELRSCKLHGQKNKNKNKKEEFKKKVFSLLSTIFFFFWFYFLEYVLTLSTSFLLWELSFPRAFSYSLNQPTNQLPFLPSFLPLKLHSVLVSWMQHFLLSIWIVLRFSLTAVTFNYELKNWNIIHIP